ncbi:MAG: hypothetical protein RLZZ546_3056, partial [Bacteroidota bacterium]
YFNQKNDRFVWTEYSLDARWNNLNYSDIFLFDLNKNKKEKITEKGRYFSPIISEDGKKIIAIFIDKIQNCSIISIDIDSKKETILLTFEPETYIFRPTFLGDDTKIAFIKKFKSKLSINTLDFKSSEVKELTSPTSHLIDNLSYNQNYIYFNGSYNGVDNIYRCNINEKDKIQQVTTVAVAAQAPSINHTGDKLIFANYTYKGFQIVKVNLRDLDTLADAPIIEPKDLEWMDKVSAISEGGNILDKLPSVQYKAKKYGGIFKGLKLHSWTPLIFDPNNPGLNLQMNNILDDASISIGASYNLIENGLKYGAGLRMAKYYPVFDLQVTRQDRQAEFLTSSDTIAKIKFNEFNASGSVSLPLKWVSGNYRKSLVLVLGIDQKLLSNRKFPNLPLSDLNQTIARTGLIYSNRRNRALQNLKPRYGLDFQAFYQVSLDKIRDEKFSTSSNIFLPGVNKNHSLNLSASYQKELLTNTYQLADVFQYAKGYSAPTNDEVYTLSLNYSLPLFYPEVGIRGLSFFKRVKMNLFYDHGHYTFIESKRSESMKSVGTELIFDNIMYNISPISYGLRYSYRLDNTINEKKGGNFNFYLALDF